jgi:two-component system chemotaxis sensor kinase CheA
MDELQVQLRQIFLEEAAESLVAAEEAFLRLEKEPSDAATIEQIFRLAHNLKGSSRAVGLDDMAGFTHKLESFLLKIKNKEFNADSKVVDLLLRCSDHINQLVIAAKNNSSGPTSEALVTEMDDLAKGTATNHQSPAVDVLSDSGEKVGDGWGLFSEPSVGIKAVPKTVPTSITEFKAEAAKLPKAGQEESIRISLSRLEKLIDNIGELVVLQTVLTQQRGDTSTQLVQRTISQLGKITKEIQDTSLSLRMTPLKSTFQKMQRIVRDTAKTLGKEIELRLEGEDTELDKTVVDHLGDPLVHLIRNAVDHGVESPEAREAAGKSKTGTVRLAASYRGGKIEILVSDDGKGLDPVKLREKAVEKGILRAGQTISDEEARLLIFHAGFSTKTEVTDVSGRGVGMDVVRTNIEKVLQGEISIESTVGSGSTFRILLPLTLSIIEGMIVRSGTERYVIPLSQMHEALQLAKANVHQTKGLGRILQLRGESLPLHQLNTMLGHKDSPASSESAAIVVRTANEPFAIAVDEIIFRQQVVIKRLGPEAGSLAGIMGSAVLGDGLPGIILDLVGLAERNVRKNGSARGRAS